MDRTSYHPVHFSSFLPLQQLTAFFPLGTAVYILSPLWPYNVSSAISLDSAPPTLVDLVDHSKPDAGQGPESVASHVVWRATGLKNVQHTLIVSVGQGQPFSVLDGLMCVVRL